MESSKPDQIPLGVQGLADRWAGNEPLDVWERAVLFGWVRDEMDRACLPGVLPEIVAESGLSGFREALAYHVGKKLGGAYRPCAGGRHSLALDLCNAAGRPRPQLTTDLVWLSEGHVAAVTVRDLFNYLVVWLMGPDGAHKLRDDGLLCDEGLPYPESKLLAVAREAYTSQVLADVTKRTRECSTSPRSWHETFPQKVLDTLSPGLYCLSVTNETHTFFQSLCADSTKDAVRLVTTGGWRLPAIHDECTWPATPRADRGPKMDKSPIYILARQALIDHGYALDPVSLTWTLGAHNPLTFEQAVEKLADELTANESAADAPRGWDIPTGMSLGVIDHDLEEGDLVRIHYRDGSSLDRVCVTKVDYDRDVYVGGQRDRFIRNVEPFAIARVEKLS